MTTEPLFTRPHGRYAYKKWSNLCTDSWPDDDDGPPWRPRPAVKSGEDRCEYGWGDFRCGKQDGHDDAHALVWNGDEDDE